MLLVAMTTTTFYLITVYTPTFGRTVLKLSAADSLIVTLCVGVTNFCWLPIGGALDDLIQRGKVVPDSRIDLARSKIGMVVRAGEATPDISSVEAFKRVLLEAKSIAYSDSASGVYLSTVLFERLGIA